MSRPKYDYRTAGRQAHKEFCKKHPSIKIDYKLYEGILRTYNDLFAKRILETGEVLKMPYGVGPLTITKYKPYPKRKNKEGKEVPNLAIDWVATRKEGKIMYHLNFHTDGYKYYWAWFPAKSFLKYSHLWTCHIARVHSRMLAVYLKKRDSKYRHLYLQRVKPRRNNESNL